MDISAWFQNNYIEVFGAVTGVIYVLLEIRQNIWLWPVGILTSAVYIVVFFSSKFYADMSLQVYYLAISILGWYWWLRGTKKDNVTQGKAAEGKDNRSTLKVTRLKAGTGMKIALAFVILYGLMWLILSRFTDSPVPEWDSFITSLSIVATWMLARKIFEHWYLWVIVNSASAVIFFIRELYPTVGLYIVYGIMSFAGMIEWKKDLNTEN